MAEMTEDLETVELKNGLSCEIPASSPLAKMLRRNRSWHGPSAQERLALLRTATTIAIVGASPNPARASYFVATYLLQSTDYDVYFVNPNADEIMGRTVYKSLADLPVVPDIVDVFRKSSDLPDVVDEIVAVGSTVMWGQFTVYNEEAARTAEAHGITVVMDRCIKIEHARFNGNLQLVGFDTGVISSRKDARQATAA